LTDYLEEVLDNAEALLEQVRRLEQGLPGPAGQSARETEDVSPAGDEEAAQGEETGGRPAVEKAEEAEGKTVRAADWNSLVYQEDRSQAGLEKGPAEPGPSPEEDGALEPPRRVQTPLEVLQTSSEAPQRTSLEVPQRVRTPLETEEGETSPLLDQVQRLERAAGRSVQLGPGQGRNTSFPQPAGTLAPPRTGTAFPDAPGVPGEGRSGGSGFVQNGASAAEELRWAEQADRAFRRDSRRYDGGFYLY